MVLRKSIVVTLSVLAAVATALPYSKWDPTRYRWNDLFAARGQEVAAQATVELSSCAAVTETRGGKPYRVRVCAADPEGISLHVVYLHALIAVFSMPFSSAREHKSLIAVFSMPFSSAREHK